MRPCPIGNGTLAPIIPGYFAALMDALQFHGASTDALLKLDRKPWEKLLGLCDLAHLTLALGEVSVPDIPAWVAQRLEKNLSDNELRYKRVLASYAEAAEALYHCGIPHLVLKGFTQAPDYVRHPRLRMQSDLDLLCLSSQIVQAQASLEAIGYKPVDKHDAQRADHLPALIRLGNWTWQGNMYDPDMPVSIELHFCLWNEQTSLIEASEVDEFWSRCEIRTLDQIDFPTLHPIDQLGYFTLHIVRGIILGDWIVHHVHELAAFLDSHVGNSQFWATWENAHGLRLRSLEAIAFWLAQAWFSCDLPPAAQIQIDMLPPSQKRWLEQFGGSPLEGMFRRNKDGRLLQFLLVESCATRQIVLQRAINPPIVEFIRRNARVIRNRRSTKIFHVKNRDGYLLYLAGRLASDLHATATFMLHGVLFWLSQRQVWLLW